MNIPAAIYRLALALWVGGAALFTLVLTPTIFRSYNRDEASGIVGVLFPGYFRWGLVCGIVALGMLLLARPGQLRLRAALLVVMLLITACNAFYIEPREAALKKEIPSFITTPADDPKRAEFRRLHGISMAGNLTVIVGGMILVIL